MKIAKKTQLYLSLIIATLLLCVGVSTYNKLYRAPYLTILGTVKMSDGLGRHSAELIQAFKGDMTIGMIHTAHPCFIDVPKEIRPIIKKKYPNQGKVLISFDSVWTPTQNITQYLIDENSESQIKIAYSMFESSRIPDEWVTILNTHFDAVVVPDSYHVKVYLQSGVIAPIFVLPLGIDVQSFLKEPLKTKQSKPFTFGNLSACIERKNQLLLIQGFHKAFGNSPEVVLKINSRYVQPQYLDQIQEYLSQNHIENVKISEHCLNHEAYLSYFSSIDCYVSLSKGEGFSIQPREAMALGIPTIVTNNTAQMTIVNSHLVTPIETPLITPASYNWNPEKNYGNWSTCTSDAVANALLQVYNDYPSHLQKAQECRMWASQYDFSQLKPLYKTLLQPNTVKLGSENTITHGTLTTTSPKLYQKYQKLLNP